MMLNETLIAIVKRAVTSTGYTLLSVVDVGKPTVTCSEKLVRFK